MSVIQETQRRREIAKAAVVPEPVEVIVTDAEAVRYTNDNTVIYSVPDWNGEVLFAELEIGLPIHVTGITDNGFFRIDLGEITAYIHGVGLSEAWEGQTAN
ncbi:MAG: hypothetical protein K2N95_15315 [Lachnospiraceae bacterium]|nr:hypothetical protein [Lachnospiraceae bacterium]